MAEEYRVDVCRQLEQKFHDQRLHRPMRIARYDAGAKLVYDVECVERAAAGRVHLEVEQFVGGGFAGQVYRVKVLEIEDGPIEGVHKGGVYAMKILVPPSGFSRLFRNVLYWVGFQGPFQLQVNPSAARVGALWQKFVRRGAEIRFGDQNAVVDIHATFVDSGLGSCGELSEWVDGRTWRLEVDDRLDLLKRWGRGKVVDDGKLGSPEYRAKRQFMADFVKLLHNMGAYELARQYEWSTCKSQPNCLKRTGTEDDPSGGLTAVDFRAGLALLPFLPMSPGDLKLIAKGIARGSLVQFDRGDVTRLEAFVQAHSAEFADMGPMLERLKAAEQEYRDSVPDLTHSHIKLLYSSRLWSTMFDSAVTGWKVRNLIDQPCEATLRRSPILTLLFFIIGAIPFLGKLVRRICGRADWRNHYRRMLTSVDYLRRAVRAKMAEKLIIWHRAGRVGHKRALKLSENLWRYIGHWLLSILPIARLHRFLSDSEYAKGRLNYIFVRPIRLYFNAALREQWLREMVDEGRNRHMLTGEDASTILAQLNEPFIQKYLKSLAVHVCTLPVTQIVSVLVAAIYVLMHPELTWNQAGFRAGGILVAFQITPISPGSLVRGCYVLYLVIRERDFKNYNIAVFLGFFKYIGYLAFPIQMTYHYPALARFMAGHWATGAVHIVPVFGEGGALLEHWIFCLFYNWPLTIRRRMQRRAEIREAMKSRYWHAALCTAAATVAFGVADFAYLNSAEVLPGLRDIWWLVVLAPLVCGAVVTLGCGGAPLGKRVVAATICGVAVGLSCSVVTAILGFTDGGVEPAWLAKGCAWRVFIFAVLSTIGALVTELRLAEPSQAQMRRG